MDVSVFNPFIFFPLAFISTTLFLKFSLFFGLLPHVLFYVYLYL